MAAAIFHDRDQTRTHIKHWMRDCCEDTWSRQGVRAIVANAIAQDTDPVDPVADSWREGTYGAWIGVLEFASEELEASSSPTIDAAAVHLRKGLSCLPHHPHAALAHVQRARTLLIAGESVSAAAPASSGAQRAREAVDLAATLLRPARPTG